MEKSKKISNVLNQIILVDELKTMDKMEKKVLIESISKYTIDRTSGEVKPNMNGLDIQIIKNFLSMYCVFDSKIFDSVSNNEFKKVVRIALTECFKLKVKRIDKTSNLNSYQIDIATNSILAFTKALLKAFIDNNYMTIVEIDGNYRLINIDEFNQIKLEAHRKMWNDLKKAIFEE